MKELFNDIWYCCYNSFLYFYKKEVKTLKISYIEIKDILRRNNIEDILLEKEILKQEFVKYSNDLFFHHWLLNRERIRTLICQEAVPDKKIISTTVRNADLWIKYWCYSTFWIIWSRVIKPINQNGRKLCWYTLSWTDDY